MMSDTTTSPTLTVTITANIIPKTGQTHDQAVQEAQQILQDHFACEDVDFVENYVATPQEVHEERQDTIAEMSRWHGYDGPFFHNITVQ